MKKLLSSLILAVSLQLAHGQATQTYFTNNMSSGIATVATAPLILLNMTAWSTNSSPTILYLYDGYYTLTNGAYTNYTVYTTNVAVSYVTTTGITNQYTNTVLKTVANAVAAKSGEVASPTVTVVIPAAPSSGSALVTFDDMTVFGRRLTISNSATGLNLVARYRLQ